MSEERRGQFGLAKPAFSVHRFKRVLAIMLNEEMAETLVGILKKNEELSGEKVPSFLYEFNSQLIDALEQPPPAKGEKPEVLAPGRRKAA